MNQWNVDNIIAATNDSINTVHGMIINFSKMAIFFYAFQAYVILLE